MGRYAAPPNTLLQRISVSSNPGGHIHQDNQTITAYNKPMVTVNPRNTEPEDTLRIRRSSFMTVIFILVAFAAGLGIGFLTWGLQPSPQANAAGSGTPAAAQPGQTQRMNVPAEGPAFGPADAAVTIIEFSDFECPYCQRWFIETWPQLQKAYEGKIRLVYRDFPLYGAHPNAEPAAEAAHCAGDQDQYWAFHDRLLSGAGLSTQAYLTFAAQLNLDQAKYSDCLNNHTYQKDIQADASYGSSLGISGTPTFFINGIPLVGAQPFSAFKSIIDQELASIK
jgi:protein-disulfide isomerase